LPIVFIAILMLPFINSQFGLIKFERRLENRNFKDTLEIDIEFLDIFPKDCEKYIGDNFSFRAPLLKAYGEIKVDLFQVTPNAERLIVGKDGWYFLAEHEKKIYEGKKDFSKQYLEAFVVEWKSRLTYFEQRNIKAYWMIPPFKHNVYPEYLPPQVYQSKPRRTAIVVDYINEIIPGFVIDPLPELLKFKDVQKLYKKHDNHWNMRAGYIASKLLLDRIQNDFPNVNIADVPKFEWDTITAVGGILADILGPEYREEMDFEPIFEEKDTYLAEDYGFPIPEHFAYFEEYEVRYTNKTSGNELKVLIIRDSFTGSMMPFLKSLFSESVYIFDSWEYQLNDPIIAEMNPDIVIYITLETLIDHIIENKKE